MLGASVLLCVVPYIPSSVGPIIVLSLSASFLQLCFAAGHQMTPSDMVGPFAGILFGFTNTMAQTSGFIAPLVIAALAPNVSESGTLCRSL